MCVSQAKENVVIMQTRSCEDHLTQWQNLSLHNLSSIPQSRLNPWSWTLRQHQHPGAVSMVALNHSSATQTLQQSQGVDQSKTSRGEEKIARMQRKITRMQRMGHRMKNISVKARSSRIETLVWGFSKAGSLRILRLKCCDQIFHDCFVLLLLWFRGGGMQCSEKC